MTSAPEQRGGRLLALDIGLRRTGVAVSDELGLYAHPRPAIHHRTTAELLREVARLCREERAEAVVVGLPLSLSGADSAQTAHVREVAAALRARVEIPVIEWDERLSTAQAARSVKGPSRRKGGELDSAAAAIVLQAVLDSRKAVRL
jgi:putative Holliday junction resolvase